MTAPALPAKKATVGCSACGLKSAPPIVVASTPGSPIGRCSNRRACERRQLRAANAKKAEARRSC